MSLSGGAPSPATADGSRSKENLAAGCHETDETASHGRAEGDPAGSSSRTKITTLDGVRQDDPAKTSDAEDRNGRAVAGLRAPTGRPRRPRR